MCFVELNEQKKETGSQFHLICQIGESQNRKIDFKIERPTFFAYNVRGFTLAGRL